MLLVLVLAQILLFVGKVLLWMARCLSFQG
jgi:hypothetical protein